MQRNFGRCLELAAGEYIKFLPADDVLEQECVARLADVLDAHPSVALVVSARRIANEQLHERAVRGYAHRSLTVSGEKAIRRAYVFGNVIGEPTAALFRRSALANGVSDYYTQLLDLDMWFRILARGDLAFVAEPLCKIRTHARQLTCANTRSTRILDERIQLFRDYSARTFLHLNWFERLIWDLRLALVVAAHRLRDRARDSGLRALSAVAGRGARRRASGPAALIGNLDHRVSRCQQPKQQRRHPCLPRPAVTQLKGWKARR